MYMVTFTNGVVIYTSNAKYIDQLEAEGTTKEIRKVAANTFDRELTISVNVQCLSPHEVKTHMKAFSDAIYDLRIAGVIITSIDF